VEALGYYSTSRVKNLMEVTEHGKFESYLVSTRNSIYNLEILEE